MKYAISIQSIKAVSIGALLIIASQTVCSVPVVGKDVPAFQESLSKLRNSPRSELKKNTPPNIGLYKVRLAKIPYINMPHKDLRGVTVTDNLRSYLYLSNLAGSNLTGASLSHANLYEANLTNATLTNTNLNGTHLYKANFSGAKGLSAEQKAYTRSQRAINVPD